MTIGLEQWKHLFYIKFKFSMLHFVYGKENNVIFVCLSIKLLWMMYTTKDKVFGSYLWTLFRQLFLELFERLEYDGLVYVKLCILSPGNLTEPNSLSFSINFCYKIFLTFWIWWSKIYYKWLKYALCSSLVILPIVSYKTESISFLFFIK